MNIESSPSAEFIKGNLWIGCPTMHATGKQQQFWNYIVRHILARRQSLPPKNLGKMRHD